MGNFEPALRAYYYNTLKYHHMDNVMYIEMRGLLSSIYRLDQTELSAIETLRVLKEETDRFLGDYPDFFGAKYIYAPHRFNTPGDIGNMIEQAIGMETEMPEYFAGFDLVGQEDKGTPLLGFLTQLLNATDMGVKFFFHAGETDWRGTKIDENLIDAVLLNTTRFGHGYALYSHPHLYERAKEKGIAVEVCPISNQILGLVKDFRNHPAANYMRDDFPVVIAADGPGIYGMTALSHDFYIAFMALGGERADLRFLKKLATNSIQYSAMSTEEKAAAMALWEAKWSIFLDDVLTMYSGSWAKEIQEIQSNSIIY
jgi:adenosine deaminase CECR1